MLLQSVTNRANGTVSYTYNSDGTVDTKTDAKALPLSCVYDIENRLISANNGPGSAATDNYDYATDNKRIYKKTTNGSNVTESVYYYSGSRKLATYQINNYGTNNSKFFFTQSSTNIYFGGKLIQAEGSPVVTDRLGTVVWDNKGAHRYFPYGEERTSTTNESSKFATYFRDQTTGLDYADQRFYNSSFGRFSTPDASNSMKGPGAASNPLSWNLYTYAEDDPINQYDPEATTCVLNSESGNFEDNGDGKGQTCSESKTNPVGSSGGVTGSPSAYFDIPWWMPYIPEWLNTDVVQMGAAVLLDSTLLVQPQGNSNRSAEFQSCMDDSNRILEKHRTDFMNDIGNRIVERMKDGSKAQLISEILLAYKTAGGWGGGGAAALLTVDLPVITAIVGGVVTTAGGIGITEGLVWQPALKSLYDKYIYEPARQSLLNVCQPMSFTLGGSATQ